MCRFRTTLFISFILVLVTTFVKGHEVRPAYLRINQIAEKEFHVYWKIPRIEDAVLKIQPVFPNEFEVKQLMLPKPVSGAMLYSYKVSGPVSIEGQTLHINGLDKTMVDVLVNVEYLNGETVTLMLHPNDGTTTIPGRTSKLTVIKNYTVLGVEHIWFGADHLLFVLALIIITTGLAQVVKTITAFTIAHSITLSLAVLGYVNFPSPPVEAVIALSILFLAVEILKKIRGISSLTQQRPWLVAFTFGLLHGLGFAGALADVGLPQNEIPLALAFFNVGVELGQIAFIVVVSLLITLIINRINFRKEYRSFPAYAIGSVAAFWMIERIIGFWN